MKHTYYIPVHRKVYGDEKDNPEVVAQLYAAYMRHIDFSKEAGRFDGVSLCDGSNEHITINNRIRLVLDCNGKGTGKTFNL